MYDTDKRVHRILRTDMLAPVTLSTTAQQFAAIDPNRWCIWVGTSGLVTSSLGDLNFEVVEVLARRGSGLRVIALLQEGQQSQLLRYSEYGDLITGEILARTVGGSTPSLRSWSMSQFDEGT